MASLHSSPLPQVDLYCPHCGYNLRGSGGERCPECGHTYQRSELSASRIPWTSRRRIGRFRAFVATLFIATFRPHLLALSAQAELSRKEARRFGLLCTLLLAALLYLLLRWADLEGSSMALINLLAPRVVIAAWTTQILYPWHVAVNVPGVVIVLSIAATRILSLLPVRLTAFLKYPPELRERAITASYYLAGALFGGVAVGCAVALLIAAGLIASGWRPNIATPGWFYFFMAMVGFMLTTALLTWCLACHRFHRQLRVVTAIRLPPFWLAFPLLLLLQGTIWLLLLPWVCGFVWLAVSSWRN